MKLKDKVAIVTGGSQGIGEAICYAYAREGAIVIVVNKSHPELGQQVAEKIKQLGGRAKAMQCDVSDEQSVQHLVETVIKKYQRVDILVNNAGVAVFKKFEDHTAEDWDYVMNVNLKGPFLLSRAVIPLMKKQHFGKIIFVGSIASLVGVPKIVPYSASKGAIISMVRGLVAELASEGINVNCISPGSVATEINQRRWKDPATVQMMSEKTPSGVAYMKPTDISGAAVYLASDDASMVHGLDLVIDNGFSIV